MRAASPLPTRSATKQPQRCGRSEQQPGYLDAGLDHDALLVLVLVGELDRVGARAPVGEPRVTALVEHRAGDEAAAAADNAVHEATKHSTDAKLSHQSSSFQSASRLSGFPEGDFLASIVTPVYGFLKREVSGLDAEAQAEP